MEEKKKSRKKIIAISIIVAIIIIAIIVGTIIIMPMTKKNDAYNLGIQEYENGEYEKAYDIFLKLDNYKDIEEYKAKCISKAKEEIDIYSNKEEYEKALNLCNFISNYEDISKKEIEVKSDYIIWLVKNNKAEVGIEILRQEKEIPEEKVGKIIDEYVSKMIYDKAIEVYKVKYSTPIRDYNVTTHFYNDKDFRLEKTTTKVDYLYNKDFPYFRTSIEINNAGNSAFISVLKGVPKTVYTGKINEDYTVSDISIELDF